jgi:hypothetical protein
MQGFAPETTTVPKSIKSTGLDQHTPLSSDSVEVCRAARRVMVITEHGEELAKAFDDALRAAFGVEFARFVTDRRQDEHDEQHDPGYEAVPGDLEEVSPGYASMSLDRRLSIQLDDLYNHGRCTLAERDQHKAGIVRLSLDGGKSVKAFIRDRQGLPPNTFGDAAKEAREAADWALGRK